MIFNKPLAARLCALMALVSLYLAFDWAALRSGLGAAIACFLSFLGLSAHFVSQGSMVFVAFSDARIQITPDCTYLDLAFILLPFTWRAGRTLTNNLSLSAAVVLGVLSLNLGRLVIAALLYEGGATWRLSHDLPDFAFYYPAIAAAVLLCARSDWRWLGMQSAGVRAGNA